MVGDHIKSRYTLDNRKKNLRAVTQAVNMLNKRVYKSSKSGIKGVRQEPWTGLWMARITREGKRQYLGLYPTPSEAHMAYVTAANQYTQKEA